MPASNQPSQNASMHATTSTHAPVISSTCSPSSSWPNIIVQIMDMSMRWCVRACVLLRACGSERECLMANFVRRSFRASSHHSQLHSNSIRTTDCTKTTNKPSLPLPLPKQHKTETNLTVQPPVRANTSCGSRSRKRKPTEYSECQPHINQARMPVCM